MIYEIVSTPISHYEGEVIFKDVEAGFDNCAWGMYNMLEKANLHKNVRVGCFDGYENCIVFEKDNFRD